MGCKPCPGRSTAIFSGDNNSPYLISFVTMMERMDLWVMRSGRKVWTVTTLTPVFATSLTVLRATSK